MSMEGIAKAGKLLCIDRGAYSDYQVTGFFVVLHDFDTAKELEEFLITHPEQREEYSFEANQFLAALLAKGLLLEIEYGVLYLGAYSCQSETRFTPMHEHPE